MRKMCAIYDRRLEAYMTPFFVQTASCAYREFATLVLNGETPISQWPGDYECHELGDFDDNTGRGVYHDAALFIVSADQVVAHARQLDLEAGEVVDSGEVDVEFEVDGELDERLNSGDQL